MTKPSKNSGKAPLLLIGWDAADWSLINEMEAKGLMPHFAALRQRATEAYLASLVPTLSPLLWTSVVTGKRAHEHGILSFVQETPQGIEAVSSQARRKPAIWNILSEAKLRTKVINWWPSHPVEAIEGEMVSQAFFLNKEKPVDAWVWPFQKAESYREAIAISVSEAELKVFFPLHSQEELTEDPLVQQVKVIIERSAQQLNVSLAALEPGSFDLGLVYFEALDQIKHLAIKYHPPQLEEISNADFEKYQHIIEGAYHWHDQILGAFMARLGPQQNYMIISDHGFAFDTARQLELSDIPAAPATEHRPFGMFMAAGPDIQAGQKLFGASLLDLFPNILYHFDLPVGDDLEGRIWTQLWKNQKAISRIPSWDPLFGTFPFVGEIQAQHKDMIKDLVALGYWDDSLSDQVEFIREEQAYNEAVSWAEAHQYLKAIALCEAHRDKALKVFRWYVLEARLRLQADSADSWFSWYENLEGKWQELVPLRFSKALAFIQAGRIAEALELMEAMVKAGVESPVLFNELAQALFLSGSFKAAGAYFERALQIDAQSARAMNGMAQIAFAEERFEDFEQWSNRSLELKFFQPQLHYLWALWHWQNDDEETAAKALDLCLSLAPKHQKARALKEKMTDSDLEEATVVVSGFPRSGTSMMMAVLEAAGLDLLVDGHRAADEHNAKGYYEWEPIKNLARGIDWPDSKGKAVKVVAPLLPYLPADRRFKVIWMNRPTVEIVLSQARMQGEQADLSNFPFEKGQLLESEKQRLQNYLNRQPHLDWISIEQGDLFSKAAEVAETLSAFLGREIKAEQLEKAVDPKLRRQRIG